MALQFSDRDLTDGIIELLHNMYYYGARWGLSVADYTGKNRKYWEVLPSKLRAAQGHPKRLEALLGELQDLADDAPNRTKKLRDLVKRGGFQKKEVVVNEQLVAVLAALPQELLAKCLGRLTREDVLPSPARFVKEHLGNTEQLIEPDFLVMADRHLLMGELKIKAAPEKPDPKYDANKLCNYLSLVYKCRQGKDNSLPTRFSHLVLLPSIHHRWFVQGPEWVLELQAGPDKRMRLDPKSCLANLKRKHRYVTDVSILKSLLDDTPIYCRTYHDVAKAFRHAASGYPRPEHWERLAGELERLAGIASAGAIKPGAAVAPG